MNRLTDHNISSSSSSSSSFSKSTSYHNPHNTEEVEKTETKKKGGVFSNWFQSSESAPTSTSSSPSPSPSSTSSSKPATTSSSSPQQLFNSTGLTKESLERLALLSPSDRFHYAALCAVCLPYNVSPGTSRSTSPSASRNSMEMEMEMGKTNETNSSKLFKIVKKKIK